MQRTTPPGRTDAERARFSVPVFAHALRCAGRSGVLLLGCLAAVLPAQQGGGAPASAEGAVDTTRATLEQWVETHRVLSKEAQDWALGKETLQARIDVVKRELTTLRERTAEAQVSVNDADKKRAEMLVEDERHKATVATLQQQIERLERRTGAILPRLPEPLRERVRPLSQRMPQAGAETKLSLGERYQNVIGILNEIQKWNREITVASEVRMLPDGSSVEVNALYVGLGQGYYASVNGKVAGTGSASREGWVWQPANDLAPDIARAIAIYKNEQVAAFVRLPVTIL
ncbi:MAG TPA: DUF3450 family protein [Planctomycetota bacterium]|nr:DUF3450 family protein [Planctomycetota bacterium]